MWRSRWRCVIKPAYSVSFLLSINIFVWQNVLYFLDAPRTCQKNHRHCTKCIRMSATSRHTAGGLSWWHHQCTSQSHRSATRKRSKRWETTFPRRCINDPLSSERCTLVYTETFRKNLLPPTTDHQFFLNICTYEKINKADKTLMCTIAGAYEE